MGFARFLKNKQIDLDGIDHYNPDLDIAKETLSSIQTGYDTTQALANTLPEHLEGDSERMLALQEKYNLEMEGIRDAYALDASVGNAMTRGLNSTIQKDFGPTGEAFRAGKRYQDVQKFKENVFASEMPLDYAQSFLDKHSSKSAFDKDGNYVAWEPPASMPTIPNFSEIMLNAGNEILPETTSIDSVEMDENGDWVAIITKAGVRRTKEEIKATLTSLAGGVPDITGAINEFGETAQKGLDDAIEGVMAAKYQNDSTLKITTVTGGKGRQGGKDKEGKPLEYATDGTRIIGQREGALDKEAVTSAELTNEKEGYINTKTGEWVPPIKSDEILDYENKTEHANQVAANLEADYKTTQNVEKDLYSLAGDDLAKVAILENYTRGWDDTDPLAAIDESASEYFSMREDEAVQDEDAIVSTSPNTNTRYFDAMEDFTIATLMQSGAGEIEDNFLALTPEEKSRIKTKEDLEGMLDYKIGGYGQSNDLSLSEVEEKVKELTELLDEKELTDNFNRTLDGFDSIVNRRNGIVNKKEVIDARVEEQALGDMTSAEKKVWKGQSLSTEDLHSLDKSYGIIPHLLRIGSKSKQDYKDIIDKKTNELAILEAEEVKLVNLASANEYDRSNGADLIDLQKKIGGVKQSIHDAGLEMEKAKDLTFTKGQLEIVQNKLKSKVEKESKKTYIPTAVRENYNPNFSYNLFTFSDHIKGIPGTQGLPATNKNLNTLARIEQDRMYNIQPQETGKGANTSWERSSNFDMNTIYDMSSGINMKQTELDEHPDGKVIGIKYSGTARDVDGTYVKVGKLIHLKEKDGEAVQVLGKQVRAVDKEYDRDLRTILYGGSPLVIKQEVGPMLDELKLTNKPYIDNTAILGNGYTLRTKKAANGTTEALVIDSISGKMIQRGKLKNIKDAYDLADRVGGLVKDQQVTSYDKEVKWDKMVSFENEINGNFQFVKTEDGSESVERRALDKEFADTVIPYFGKFKLPIYVTSMLRSLDNQQGLDRKMYNNNAGPQYTSGHLVGEGMDIRLTTTLKDAMKADGFDIDKASQPGGYVFKNMKMFYHKNAENGKMHLDIKKI